MFNAFTNGNQEDVIHTDFRKAFDEVNNKTLEKILMSSEFSEPLLFWFSSYFKNRTQCIKAFGIKFAKSVKFRLVTRFQNPFLSFRKLHQMCYSQ